MGSHVKKFSDAGHSVREFAQVAKVMLLAAYPNPVRWQAFADVFGKNSMVTVIEKLTSDNFCYETDRGELGVNDDAWSRWKEGRAV
jgi:hypothetical protein